VGEAPIEERILKRYRIPDAALRDA